MNYLVVCLFIAISSFAHASEAIPGNFDKVWGASISSISERGLTIVNSDKASGLISTQPVKLPGAYNVPARIKRVAKFTFHVVPFNDARYSVNVLVLRVDDNQSSIAITPIIEGFNREEWVRFDSNGTIEKELTQSIKNKLGSE
jgi:hypothetical protein